MIEIITHDNITLRGLSNFVKNDKTNAVKKSLTVLSCSPYRNFENVKEFRTFSKFLETIPAHYIYMDVRGTGESEGYAENEYSINELKDTNEIIKYIREQEWSNGYIMMHGISYSAFNALQSCSLKNKPNFLFLMHVSNDRWNNDIHYFGGIKTIMDDINYSFATTGQNLLPCISCLNSKLKKIKIPWFMKWFKQGSSNNNSWKNGMLNLKNKNRIKNNNKSILPPTFLICGWRDIYSSTAVKLSNIMTFTLIGPFGHSYPKNHNLILKDWIYHTTNNINNNNQLQKIYNKIEHYNGPICVVIPTPKSLWKLGYYQIKSYNNPNYKIFFKSNELINLVPDLVGESLEVYTSGDPVIKPSLNLVRKDLKRIDKWGYEKEILLDNYGVWGEPELVINCLDYEKGDYIVARLTYMNGETLSVGVLRLKKGKNIIKMKPFFIPVNTYKIYLFLNRSWVPVLFPTTNMNNIILNDIYLSLPIITIQDYIKLNMYATKSEMSLLKDVTIKNIMSKSGKLIYETVNEYKDGTFSEKVNLLFILGVGTKVYVENKYKIDDYNIKTITQINSNKTDSFYVKINAYNNNELIHIWKNKFILGE